MPIHFTIDHKARHVEAKFDGNLVLKDVEDFCDAVVGQDALPYRKLIDGRTASGTYTNDDVMALGGRMAAYATLGKRGALALVPGARHVPGTGGPAPEPRQGRPAGQVLPVDRRGPQVARRAARDLKGLLRLQPDLLQHGHHRLGVPLEACN